jgi:hypothetical protein
MRLVSVSTQDSNPMVFSYANAPRFQLKNSFVGRLKSPAQLNRFIGLQHKTDESVGFCFVPPAAPRMNSWV